MTVGELLHHLRAFDEGTDIRVISSDIADDIGTITQVEEGEEEQDATVFLVVG